LAEREENKMARIISTSQEIDDGYCVAVEADDYETAKALAYREWENEKRRRLAQLFAAPDDDGIDGLENLDWLDRLN
jgi:hypothetical protein